MTETDDEETNASFAATEALLGAELPKQGAVPKTAEEKRAEKRAGDYVLAGKVRFKEEDLRPYSAMRHYFWNEFKVRLGSRSKVGDGYLVLFVLCHKLEYLERMMQAPLNALQLRVLVVKTVQNRFDCNGDVLALTQLGEFVMESVYDARFTPVEDAEDESGNAPGRPG